MRRNVIVGLFVLFGMLALGTLIVLFGQQPTWFAAAGRFTLDIHFNSVSGVKTGTPVTIGGIPVGRVEEVGFRDPNRFDLGARVLVSIEPAYDKIPLGTHARTSEPGLGMGRPPIELIPPAVPVVDFLPSGSTIAGEMVPAMDAILPAPVRANIERAAMQMGEAAGSAKPVLEDLHLILQQRSVADVDAGREPGNLASALARVDSFMKHMNEVAGDPNVQSQIRVTAENVAKASEDIKVGAADIRAAAADAKELVKKGSALADRATETMTNFDEQVERVADGAVTAMQSGDQALRTTNDILTKINTGQGTLGQLLNDPRAYEAVVLSFQRLAEMVGEFNLLVKEWQKGRIKVSL